MAKTKKTTPEPITVPAIEEAPTPAPTPAPEHQPVVLTIELAKAKFNRELTLHRYQARLQEFLDWKVTTENVPQTQQKTKDARGLIKVIKDIKAKLKQPALDECDMWESAFKSLLQPLEAALSDKDKELQVISQKIAEENRKIQLEKERRERIEKEIDDFILRQSTAIANATTDTELVAIEKMLGSHSGNKSRYEEFLPNLVSRIKELTPKIKEQKETIRQILELEKKRIEAEKQEDDATLLQLQEKKEQLESNIEENKIIVQETAIASVTRPSEITQSEQLTTELKARRRSWDFELADERKAFTSGMLVCELNKDKVKSKLLEIKDDMIAKGETERVVDGVKYFYKVVY